MRYQIEQQTFAGFAFHPMNYEEHWKLIDSKSHEEDAKKVCLNFAQKNKGTYQVRDIYSGKVLMKITI